MDAFYYIFKPEEKGYSLRVKMKGSVYHAYKQQYYGSKQSQAV